ncbi:hypothetical protein [Kitasatospora kifunensis]|uniref:Uncharacterized protein n=1 Tax=Kitasatospora kifunensis TaxID=58351 RepID=A0A7W7RBD8_KITKI|nr:hypothetical protein [Kitasatospora kifunensis]MBB4928745.1 hypothetical protein [Kitasatospora kifunensis]
MTNESNAPAWRVMRQEDNGNQYLVARDLPKDEAQRLAAELEAGARAQAALLDRARSAPRHELTPPWGGERVRSVSVSSGPASGAMEAEPAIRPREPRLVSRCYLHWQQCLLRLMRVCPSVLLRRSDQGFTVTVMVSGLALLSWYTESPL